MGVAHRVLDQQVGHGVPELGVAGPRGVSLELAIVLAVRHHGRIHERVDRLAGDAHVQPDQAALVVEARGQLAL